MFFRRSKGFTIVEVMVATAVLMVGVVGIYFVFTRTISFIPYITSKFTAAYLVQEGIEIVRNIRDTNWIEGVNWKDGLTDCVFGCEADYKTGTPQEETPLRPYAGDYLRIDGDNFYSYGSGTTSPYKFQRQIIIEEITGSPEFLKITTIVEWEIRGEKYNIEAEDHLYDWY